MNKGPKLDIQSSINMCSGIITLIGFATAVIKATSLKDYEADFSANFSPIIGSTVWAIVCVILAAVCFGYVFGQIIVGIEKRYGRFSILLSPTVLGIVSAYQTGAVTIVIMQLFDVKLGTGLFLAVSLFFCSRC